MYKTDYIKYKLQKADDSPVIAEMPLQKGFWADALSKTYYAAFYTVSALLINKELNPKTYPGAKSLFHKEFVFTGIVNKQFAELYDLLLAKRFEADYELFALIDEQKVPLYLKDVKEFIATAKNLLNQ